VWTACQYLHFAQTEDIQLKSALEGKIGVLLITGRSHHHTGQCLYSQTLTSTHKEGPDNRVLFQSYFSQPKIVEK
jgi:hypothetical protein